VTGGHVALLVVGVIVATGGAGCESDDRGSASDATGAAVSVAASGKVDEPAARDRAPGADSEPRQEAAGQAKSGGARSDAPAAAAPKQADRNRGDAAGQPTPASQGGDVGAEQGANAAPPAQGGDLPER
jgi:hypothetical protein